MAAEVPHVRLAKQKLALTKTFYYVNLLLLQFSIFLISNLDWR